MNCPDCHSTHTVKNGLQPKTKKQKHLCRDCVKQFVADPDKQRVSGSQKRLIDLLLLERISLCGIARVVGVSERWLQYYVNGKYAPQPHAHWTVTAGMRWNVGVMLVTELYYPFTKESLRQSKLKRV